MTMSGLRRAHTSSRNGCTQCKKWRKKCDETPPRCKNCRKRDIKCDYEDVFKAELSAADSIMIPDFQPLKVKFKLDKRSNGTTPPPPCTTIVCADKNLVSYLPPTCPRKAISTNAIDYVAHFSVRGLQLDDIELMQHYSTVTTLSVTAVSLKRSFYKRLVPQTAQSYDFVMHALLAVSALHLAYLQPQNRCRYSKTAMCHQHKAITQFRAAINTISAENCRAVCVFSGLGVLYELGLLHPSYSISERNLDYVDVLLQRFLLMRKTASIWGNSGPPPHRNDTNVGNVPLDESGVGYCVHLSRGVYLALNNLQSLNQALTPCQRECDAYQHAIEMLKHSFENTASTPENWTKTLQWGVLMSPLYANLLAEKQPLALVILAHFCVLAFHAPVRWFMEGWSNRVFGAVEGLLDESWREHIAWAKRAMWSAGTLSMTADGIQVCGFGAASVDAPGPVEVFVRHDQTPHCLAQIAPPEHVDLEGADGKPSLLSENSNGL